MSVQSRKFAVELLRSHAPRRHGFSRGFEKPKVNVFPVRSDKRGPSVTVLSFMNATKARFISLADFAVLQVLSVCGLAQIFPSVVAWVSVSMVDLGFWPLARYVKPRKSVREKHTPEDTDEDISVIPANPGPAALSPARWTVFAPREVPGSFAVTQNLPQKCVIGKSPGSFRHENLCTVGSV